MFFSVVLQNAVECILDQAFQLLLSHFLPTIVSRAPFPPIIPSSAYFTPFLILSISSNSYLYSRMINVLT